MEIGNKEKGFLYSQSPHHSDIIHVTVMSSDIDNVSSSLQIQHTGAGAFPDCHEECWYPAGVDVDSKLSDLYVCL